MKVLKFSFFFFLFSFFFLFTACPPPPSLYYCDICGELDCYGDCVSENKCPICGELDHDGALVITGELDNAKWIEILNEIAENEKPVCLDLFGCTFLESAPSGSIYYNFGGGSGAFDPRANGAVGEDGKALIKAIKLPNHTRVIPDGTADNYAFKGFTSLKSITGEPTQIGNFAFYGLTTLEKINFDSEWGVQNILKSAFEGCTSLKTVNFPKAINAIDHRAFAGCTGLESVSFDKITWLAVEVFADCTNLATVTMPALQTMQDRVFKNCINLQKIDFPEAVTIGAPDVFSGCTGLKTVNLPKYFWVDGDERRAILPSLFEDCINLESIDIPLITFIHPGTFDGLTKLKTVKFDNLTKLEPAIFIDCINLESVNMPLIETIFERTFKDLTKLKTVDFPNVTVIGDEAFMGCTNLSSISFPKVTTINPSAFEGCTSLVEVSFPSATRIYKDVFKNCTSLTTARFYASPTPTSPDSLYNGHPLGPWLNKTGHFTEETIYLGVDAFRGCVNLKVLDVRYAWNVYFHTGALAEIGEELDIYLYDDGGRTEGGISFGHPQIDLFLGGTWGENDSDYSTVGVSLKTIRIFVPNEDSMMINNKFFYGDEEDPGGNIDDRDAGYRGIEASIIAIYNWIYYITYRDSIDAPKVTIVSPIP